MGSFRDSRARAAGDRGRRNRGVPFCEFSGEEGPAPHGAREDEKGPVAQPKKAFEEAFTELTAQGHLRHSKFRHLREPETSLEVMPPEGPDFDALPEDEKMHYYRRKELQLPAGRERN
jgi:hypothetical protein